MSFLDSVYYRFMTEKLEDARQTRTKTKGIAILLLS